ncbi:MAG TPA: hypothetical protein VII30_03335 [Gemmatimonadaceae bacterium]
MPGVEFVEDDAQFAQYEYSTVDQSEMHELSGQEMAERDSGLSEMWRLEQRMVRALNSGDEQEQSAAWDEFVEGVVELNRWILNVNSRISADFELLLKRGPEGGEFEAASALSNWADEFEELELPGVYDYEAPEMPQVDWRRVGGYPEKSSYDWSEHW